MSALTIPFLASLLIWGEPLTGSGAAGLLLVLAGIGCLAAGRRDAGTGRINFRWLLLAALNLLGYGLAQTCMGVPSHWAGWSDAANLRTPMSALFCGLQQLGILFFLRRLPQKRAVPRAFFYSLIYFSALLGIYAALDILSRHGLSRIFWPLGSGFCITVFTIYSHVVKKERFCRWDLAGLAGIVAGLVLLAEII
jgi:multidrug transporter EmrE-like cation transporter